VDAFAVFGIQTFFSFVVFGLLAWWYVWPWLRAIDRTAAFTALTFVHALRPIGATVLVASVAGTALPRNFAEGVAYGDLATSVLAIVTLLALRARLGLAIALVFGVWFLVAAVVLRGSGGIVHPYYASALAPGVGAMAGAGAIPRREGTHGQHAAQGLHLPRV